MSKTRKDEPQEYLHNIDVVKEILEGGINVSIYTNSDGVDLPYLQKDRERPEQKYDSFLLCKHCHRYISMYNNTPCQVPCSHTFCEVCLYNEKTLRCKVCKVDYSRGNEYIVNKSYKNLLEKFVEKGQKCFLDSVYQEYHHLINKRLKEISTYLPMWEEQSLKGKRFQMTLGFWNEEIQFEKEFAKEETCSPTLMEKLQFGGKLMSKVDSLLEYQTTEWDETIQEHTQGTKIVNFIYPTYLTINFVVKKKDIYMRSTLDTTIKLYYFKVSSGIGTSVIHVHAGCRRNELSQDFEEENVIMEWDANLYGQTEGFIDVSFQINEKRKMTRMYFIFNDSSNKSKDFERKVILSLLGQEQSLKGVKICSKNGYIVIPDPNPYNSLFDIPSSYDDQVLTDKKHNYGDVIGRKTPFTELMILTNLKGTFIKGDHYLVGKIKSGLSSIEDALSKAECLIEDCGLLLASKSF